MMPSEGLKKVGVCKLTVCDAMFVWSIGGKICRCHVYPASLVTRIDCSRTSLMKPLWEERNFTQRLPPGGTCCRVFKGSASNASAQCLPPSSVRQKWTKLTWILSGSSGG